MFEWFFLLFAPILPMTPPADYVGQVAAEAAYAALLPDNVVKPDTPPDPNCKTCEGTGRVRSGDGQGWTKCPTCQPLALKSAPPFHPAPLPDVPQAPAGVKVPKSDPTRYIPSSR